MKIVTIIGARPQFIKAATLNREFKKFQINEIIIHTGQHFDINMSDIFFKELDIDTPKYNLGISSLSHGKMTGEMIAKIEEILILEEPNFVLVYGDTNSTLSGAIAASKLSIPIIHIEAGLRSFNNKMPEEINRILTDRISYLLFTPTKAALKNLISEGYKNHDCKIFNYGDVMYDSSIYFSKKINTQLLNKLQIKNKKFILTTIHRQENVDDNNNLINIITALNKINEKNIVLFPVHPRTKNKIEKLKIKINFNLIEPVGYLDMINLIKNSSSVITDSGGLQKEAFFFKKICLTIREETEWVELLDIGVNRLVKPNHNEIIETFYDMINNYENINFDYSLYGKGNSAKKIVKEILKNI